MPKRKSTLIAIIVLLIIFLPLAIYATILHINNKNPYIDNPNHEFNYEGKLYFYENDILLGTYTCQHTDYCDYAIFKNEFLEPVIEHKPEKSEKSSIIQNRYVFLMDTHLANLANAEIILYDLKNNQELVRYKAVKNYGIGMNNEYYIVKNKEEKWGVISLADEIKVILPLTYDYIALPDKIDSTTNKIIADTFSVLENNSWSLVDNQNKKISENFIEKIVTFNQNSIIVSNGDRMRITDYAGRNLLVDTYKYLNYCGKYLAIVNEANIFYLYDLANNKEVGNRYNVENPKDLTFEVTDKYIHVKVKDELIENIAIR